MKHSLSLLALLLACASPFFWSCSGSGDGPSAPPRIDTTGRDTGKGGKGGPDTSKGKPDTLAPGAVDTAALLQLLGRMADSGLSLGLERVRTRGFDQDLEAVWASVPPESSGFTYSVRQFGLFKRIHVAARVKAGSFRREKRVAARVGQILGLDEFPSLGITSTGGSFGLALHAEVEGPVYIPNGRYQLLRDAAIQYRGSVKTLQVWDSTSAFAKLLPITFGSARAWVKEREREIAALRAVAQPADDAEWESVALLEPGTVLAGASWDGAKILCPGRLVLGDGAVLKDCQILAAEIGIQGNAQVSGLAFAAGGMTIEGRPSLRGQFLAGDSMRIDVLAPLEGFPIFYVQGQDTVGSPSGSLDVVRASGQGVFLYSGDSLGINVKASPPTLHLGPETDLQGFAYTRGTLGVFGRFRGSVVGRMPVFEKDGTLYVCCLGYGDLGLAPPGTAFPFAGTLSGYPPALVDRRDRP